jgi:Tfp pilus assembly protein PilF
MGMSIQAAACAGICIWLAVTPPAFSQSAPGKQQQIDSHSRQAQEFLRQGKPDLAAGEFNAILKLDANNVDAHANLGVAFFFKGDYAKAAPELRSAVKLRPSLWKIQALLGLAEKRLGQTSAAQTDLNSRFRVAGGKARIQTGMELIEIHYAAGLIRPRALPPFGNSLPPTSISFTPRIASIDLAGESTLTMAMLALKSARMHQIMAQEWRTGNTDEPSRITAKPSKWTRGSRLALN